MRKLLLITTTSALFAGAATAEDVKLGVLMGFTGPIESLVPNMSASAKIAIEEVNQSGLFLNGSTLIAVEADSTCIDSAAATSAAERLITTDNVAGIIGADCSGVTSAVLQNVARPNGVVMISPSATSPSLTTAKDDGLFFRTAPSDTREGEVMADSVFEKGFKSVALTYTNNDYGKGLSEAFATAYTAKGGIITINAAHEDGKADYSAEVGALAAAGGDILVVVGYLGQGGQGIIQGSLDSGAFDKFVLPDGMVGDALPAAIGPALNGSFGQIAGSDSTGAATFEAKAKEHGFDGTSAYSPGTYDAAALFALAMQAAKSTKSADYAGKILNIANAPGEKIYAGELAKGLQLILDGQDIDFEGTTAIELIGPGDSAGRYREIEVKNGKIETVGFR